MTLQDKNEKKISKEKKKEVALQVSNSIPSLRR